jgi:alpha-galactosidase
MNRRKFFQGSLMGVAGLSALANPLRGLGAGPGSGSSLKPYWPANGPRLFREVLEEGAGFSFSYGGKRADLISSEGWKTTTQTTVACVETLFRHTSGLVVVRRIKAYLEFEALEYTVTFRNESSSSLPAVGPINALDVEFGKEALLGAHVVSSGGGLDDSTYPPETYAIRQRWIGPMTPIDGRITLRTKGGRSSNKDLPFYFVQNDRKNEGLFVAIGWSGQWSSEVSGNFEKNTLRLAGGIPDLHIRLRPGEAIRGPRILIGCYSGLLSSGSNRLRRFIRTHCTPLLEGQRFEPVLTYDHWWNIGEHFDQELLERLADAAASIGQEYFLLDAGWYTGADGPEGFSGGVGNWEKVDRRKFPSGLKPFADYVRSKGLKFGLWFEPERVAKGTLLAKDHPDWVLWPPPSTGQNPSEQSQFGLLDYSRPEVREWVRKLLDDYIQKLDVRYIRHDFNINPLPYWEARDTKDRKGITQVRHIEGFYEVIDWIRKHHPQSVLEGCSSGGRRIDLETASRFHTFWISDQTMDPDIVRFHLEGMNYFLPGNYGYVCYALPLPAQQPFQASDYGFQSFFGGAFGMGGRIDRWTVKMKDQAQRHVEVYKKIRKFLVKDYYALAPGPCDIYSWEGWQFHDPRTGEGFVQVFRAQGVEASKRFGLKALNPQVPYQFTEPYSGKVFQIAGADVTSEGLVFDVPKQSSRILIYKPVR